MSHNDSNQNTFEGDALFKAPLGDTPSTQALQSRILQATSDLPQQLNVDTQVSANSPLLVKQFMPFAIAASIALFAFLALPGFLTTPNLVDNVVINNGLSVDEIDYQEAILLYDEFMFAQL